MDIAKDPIPAADLCLIRQVLQHLSNAQIKEIVEKLSAYKFTLITERYPSPRDSAVPNVDKVHGADVRLYDHSAVFLDQPPFNVANLKLLLEDPALHPVLDEGETLRTFLIEGPPIIRSAPRVGEVQKWSHEPRPPLYTSLSTTI